MSRWRKEAFHRLPECRRLLQEEKSPYVFLGLLVHQVHAAYLRKDESMIRRIYEYARWCFDAPEGKDASDDLPTVVTVSFFEHLPRHAEIRRDIGRWFSKKQIEGMREVFLYHGTKAQFQEMVASCPVHRSKKRPNQSPEPTVMLVTPRADARVAPSTTVAHL